MKTIKYLLLVTAISCVLFGTVGCGSTKDSDKEKVGVPVTGGEGSSS